MAKVLVLDGHSAAALAFTRSLGRAGHWVSVGASSDIFAPAARSRFCRASFIHPSSMEQSSGFVDTVLDFVRSNSIELIIPVTDWTTFPLSFRRQEFIHLCHLALPSHESLEWAADKYRTIELARTLNIPVPDTWLIKSHADLEALPPLSFPVVLKDRFSVRWIETRSILGSVEYAFTREDLLRKAGGHLQLAGDVLVQRYVKGTGVGFSCFALKDESLVPFQWQRIREVDPRGSGSSARKSVALNPQITQYGKDLIRKLGFEGIAMVEYKSEDSSGRPLLMEVNGRPWGSMQLAVASGIDYPRYVADWWLKRAVPPHEIPYRQDITCRRMVGELTHLEHLRHGSPPGWPMPYRSFWSSLLKISTPWYPGMRYDDLSLSDPFPGLAGLANWFAVRLKKRLRRLVSDAKPHRER